MRNFKKEDFTGCGQYLMRNDGEPNTIKDDGYMSTIMNKVGYIHNRDGTTNTLFIAMSDGWTMDGYYITENENGDKIEKKDWKFIPFLDEDKHSGKNTFVAWLNNPKLSEEYRFATQEEVSRVVNYQSSRWRNP